MRGDNAPIEPALLKSLTGLLSFRGPDGREVCLDGAVGMGHTLLRATHEAKTERQPASLEGRYRIVADARLDAREELIDELKRAKRNLCSNAADCDNATTVFRDIQRLPPAHSLTVSSRGMQVKCYWAPPTDGRIRYAKPQEYVERFDSIFEKAVADRLRTERAGIL